ncbi:MAG: serine protease [Bacteroidota bacterium]
MVLDLIASFLGLYLAFTNTLAERVATLLPNEPEPPIIAHNIPPTESRTLTPVASKYSTGGPIPQILVDNATWQQASVLAAATNSEPVDPRDAVVNIYCTYQSGEYLRATTGTGFFVSNNGIILTNAHVAQFLLIADLLDEGGTGECVVRTGTPAVATYEVELLYISPAWLREHAALFKTAEPKGTGERDYALLYVNQTVDNGPLPVTFPSLDVNVANISRDEIGDAISVYGYPAETSFSNGEQSLLQVTASSSITELLTFGTNLADLMSIGGTPLGQQGASGGPIINDTGEVVGLVVTRGDDAQFGAGSLRAITLSYINRTMLEETGIDFAQNLTGNLRYRADLYRRTMVPFLETILRWELET